MIKYFAQHPTAANLLMIIFLIMGALSISSIRRETFPDYISTQVQIQAIYPGASTEEVEEAVCQRIENAVDGINYVSEVRSTAREGVAVVIVEMSDGGDMSTFINDIRQNVETIDSFPAEVKLPVVTLLNRDDLVVNIAVTGSMPLVDLKKYCEQLKDQLKQEEGVSQVTVKGFSDAQIQIHVPVSSLMQYNLSLDDISTTIRMQSLDMPAGMIETSDQDILIKIADLRRTPDELSDLVVVSSRSGASIRLGNIARISETFEKAEEKISLNGKKTGLLQITKNKQEDILAVFDSVDRFLQRIQKSKPRSVEFHMSQDKASVVRERLALLIKNGWQGLLLVFFALWLFFDFKLAFWVALGLPVSFAGALFFFPKIGLSINMMTMVALLIALGLLMDDAIVITENIVSHLHKGKSSLKAVVAGVTEVANGVVSSYLTTVCVFGPLAFITGNMGKVLRVVPMVLILVLTVSLVEAFLILPHHLAHSSNPDAFDEKKRNWFRRKFDEAFLQFREKAVGGLVDKVVTNRYLSLGLVAGIFIFSISMIPAGILKFVAFPDSDGDYIEARILMPPGTSLGRTEEVVDLLSETLKGVDSEFSKVQPSGQKLVRALTVQYSQNITAGETGSHVATMIVDLLPAGVRVGRIAEFLAKWRELTGDVPGALSIHYTQSEGRVAGLPLEVRLTGDNLDELKAASESLKSWFTQFQGVFNLSDDLRPGKPEIKIRLKSGAHTLGVTTKMIASQFKAAFQGVSIAEIQRGKDSLEVIAQVDHISRNSIADLETFHVLLPDGTLVPASVVADFTMDRGYSTVSRVNGQRTLTIQGDVDNSVANSSEILSVFSKTYEAKLEQNHPGIKVSIKGQASESAKTATSMGRALLIGILGIFVILSFQFNSYTEPLVVMTAIPLALIGAIWGHILLSLNFSTPSMIGFISLAGIVVNDSILLVEFIKMGRQEGLPLIEAASQASRQRFRAIFLTSVTTTAGLLPLLSETSAQAKSLVPLAASIVFGLTASTLLVLLIVPALYMVIADFGLIAAEKTVENTDIKPIMTAEADG
jgi:multidrug efflux pump subunit AcrB